MDPKKPYEPHSIRPLTQDEIASYKALGYVIIRGLFDAKEMELVRAVCQSDPSVEASLKTIVDVKGKTWGAAVWTGLNDSLVSVITQTARMVEAVEALVGSTPYHMYSKIVQKPAHDDSTVSWHQAFPAWYREGCLFPDFFTDCSIAITDNTKANGCLQVIEKSHLLGRVDCVEIGNALLCDPKYITNALKHLKIIDCEMAAGDTVFFHSNTIHGSLENKTNETRILMHCHYNAMSNRPSQENLEAHSCLPINKMPDSAIKDGVYTHGFISNAKDWNWYNTDPDDLLHK